MPQPSAERDSSPTEFESQGQRYAAPTSLDELASLFQAHPHARLLAGATDVGVWLAKQDVGLPFLLSVNRVAELADVELRAEVVTLGAAAPYARCQPVLEALWPELGAMLRRLGSPQIRNLGTVGGNLATASPIGDMAPALLALDARLHLRCGETVRVLPLRDFFLGYRRTALAPGEFITAVEIDRPTPVDVFKVWKITKRFEEDISTVCAAFHVRLEAGVVREFRAAWGGMAATPVRSYGLERLLVGRRWDRASVAVGMEQLDVELTPLSDARGSAAYRSAVARNLMLKLFLETTGASDIARISLRAA